MIFTMKVTKEWIMKHRKGLIGFMAVLLFAISAFSIGIDENKATVDANVTDINISTQADSNDTLFEKRFVYFDRSLASDENFELLKKVIVDAHKLGFNGLVLSQEYIYSRLSHKNPIIDKMKKALSEIEKLVHQNNMELVMMHFSAEVPNTVVHDRNEANPFYNKDFDFSEANEAKTIYDVVGEVAVVSTKSQTVTSPALLDRLYHFDGIKPNTEYKLTLNATTKNFTSDKTKVSLLDEDHKGENGKILYGPHKFFYNIEKNANNKNYSVYFNSLNHKNTNGKIKVYLKYPKGLVVNSLTLQESGYVKSVHVQSKEHTPVISTRDGTIVYKEGKDYILTDNQIRLFSDDMRIQKELLVTWYPRVNVSRESDHLPKADACADEKLYHKIMKDQLNRVNQALNNKIDSVALYIDEWREAGWNKLCPKLYEKEFNSTKDFTGGDYIGITTKRMIESLGKDNNYTFYLMSDMFDPNFNAKDPYMGVNLTAEGATKYLPKDKIVMFNWFPNPNEPGLEDKTDSDFLASAKYFADNDIKQIIAGYHDDMANLDSNIAFYKDSNPKTQESIVGFMFLIWHQKGKNPTYDDMDDVVERICTDLPDKWPSDGCKEASKK